jgi:hypothetical protein
MDCRTVQESLGDYSVGLLDSGNRAALDEHVGKCPECAREHRRFYRSLAILDQMESPQPPANLWLGIRARLASDGFAGARGSTRGVHPPLPAARYSWLSSVAAVLAGVIVTTGLLYSTTIGNNNPDSGFASTNQQTAPAAVSVSRLNSLDINAPLSDGSSFTVVDAMSMPPATPFAPQYGARPQQGFGFPPGELALPEEQQPMSPPAAGEREGFSVLPVEPQGSFRLPQSDTPGGRPR